MKYQPLFNNVLVKPLKKEEGTIITEPDPTEPVEAEVVAAGLGQVDSVEMCNLATNPCPNPHVNRVPMEVAIEDKILFFPRDAKKLKLDGEDYYLLNQEDILLKII